MHTAAVTLTGTVVFQPGRHVFCQGVTVAAGATVTGTGVLWYVPTGGVRVDATATVDLAAANSGPYVNLLVWSAGSSAVDLRGGSGIDNYRGVVYAPQARVTLDGTTAEHLGGIVSAQATIGGAGPVRIGLPIPTFTSSPSSLATGQTGVAYPLTLRQLIELALAADATRKSAPAAPGQPAARAGRPTQAAGNPQPAAGRGR